MTDEQEAHLAKIKEQFLLLVDGKYRNGVAEHGGNLWDMGEFGLVQNALNEAIDQITYLVTLTTKLGKAAHGVQVIGEDTILQIACEMSMSNRDHGPLTTDFCRAFSILTEELGEVGKEILAMTRTKAGIDERKQSRNRAIKETFQVIAVAIYLIRNLKKYEGEEVNAD